MFRHGKRTMRRQFSLLVVSLTLFTALIYTVLVDRSLTRGFEEMVQLSMHFEIEDFETATQRILTHRYRIPAC